MSRVRLVSLIKTAIHTTSTFFSTQTPAPSAQWCQKLLCVSSWRWLATTHCSWVELTVTMSPSLPRPSQGPPLPPPPLPQPPRAPRPSSAKPFEKLSHPRAWGGSWRCSWRLRCLPASSRRGSCADRASKVLESYDYNYYYKWCQHKVFCCCHICLVCIYCVYVCVSHIRDSYWLLYFQVSLRWEHKSIWTRCPGVNNVESINSLRV